LRHEHLAIDLQADGFAQIDTSAAAIGAIAVDDLAVEVVIGQRRTGDKTET